MTVPFLRLGVQGRDRSAGGGAEAQWRQADERANDPRA
jgi:hypothetical protein